MLVVTTATIFCPPQILEYTPRDHSDRPHLTLALDEAEKLCQKVNEGVQQQENTERLEWMQSHIQLTLNEVSLLSHHFRIPLLSFTLSSHLSCQFTCLSLSSCNHTHFS